MPGWPGIFVAYPAWAFWLAGVEARLGRHARSIADGPVRE
jgi:hypothetical protein